MPTPAPEPADRQWDELFVEFANTLEFTRGEPVDAVPDALALLGWLRERDVIDETTRHQEATRVRRDADAESRTMERFRHLRDLVHAIAAGADAGEPATAAQVRDLNHVLRHGLHYHQLRRQDGDARYTFTSVGDPLDQARAAIAGSLARFLAEDDATRLRTCDNAGCRYVFVDRSRSGRRRWCDMRTCGNQAKVARHRARAKTTRS